MILEEVHIEGFKSFSEKTEMGFQPGIGVVIGNNGVGKSNILDAIVWALGEAIGIIGFINYMLTINHQYLLVFSVVSVYSILINMPRLVVAEKCIELVKENL